MLMSAQVAATQEPADVDPAAARKAAEEAEERRLAEIRSHGTMVTPQTFAEWKARFDAEIALARSARPLRTNWSCPGWVTLQILQ